MDSTGKTLLHHARRLAALMSLALGLASLGLVTAGPASRWPGQRVLAMSWIASAPNTIAVPSGAPGPG